ncbi:MAG: sigma-70 family RNA polymerase sigma factor [Myxococcota bacterium]
MKPSELQRVLDGQRQAIDRFVRDYSSTVEKAVAVALRGRVGALPRATLSAVRRDVVGDIWCWLLDRERTVLRSYDAARGTMEGFLFMKVCSEARRVHDRRYRARTDPMSDDESGSLSLPSPHQLGVRYEQYDHAKKLWAEIESQLSPAERDAFVGRILQGKSAREVAQELGRSEDAVHQGVSRAIRRARKILARRRGPNLETVLGVLLLLMEHQARGGPVDSLSAIGALDADVHAETRA